MEDRRVNPNGILSKTASYLKKPRIGELGRKARKLKRSLKNLGRIF
jgi:hypothetical protein